MHSSLQLQKYDFCFWKFDQKTTPQYLVILKWI